MAKKKSATTPETVTAEIVEDTKVAMGELQGDQATQDKLLKMEKVYINGISTVCQMGKALTTIRDEKLYKARGYNTFETYAKKFFEISKSYAYRLISYNRVIGLIGENPDVKIAETFIRPLTAIHDDDKVKEIWEEAKENGATLPTAEKLAKAVDKFKTSEKKKRKETKKSKAREGSIYIATLNRNVKKEKINKAFVIEQAENNDIEKLQKLCTEVESLLTASDKKAIVSTAESWQKTTIKNLKKSLKITDTESSQS